MAKPSLEVARAPVAGAAVSAAVQQPGDPRPSLEEDAAITTARLRPSRRLPTTPRARATSLPGPDAAAMGAKGTLAALPKGFADDWVSVVTRAIDSNVLK